MTIFRDHEPDGKPCWCHQKMEVSVGNVVIGMATPLDDGNYSIEFNNDGKAQEAMFRIIGGEKVDIVIDDPFRAHEGVQTELPICPISCTCNPDCPEYQKEAMKLYE